MQSYPWQTQTSLLTCNTGLRKQAVLEGWVGIFGFALSPFFQGGFWFNLGSKVLCAPDMFWKALSLT